MSGFEFNDIVVHVPTGARGTFISDLTDVLPNGNDCVVRRRSDNQIVAVKAADLNFRGSTFEIGKLYVEKQGDTRPVFIIRVDEDAGITYAIRTTTVTKIDAWWHYEVVELNDDSRELYNRMS